MSYTVVRETVNYTMVLNKQIDRVAEAISSLDLTTKMVGRKKLLDLVNAVEGLYILTRAIPSVKMPDYDDLLEKIFIAVVMDRVDEVGGVLKTVKALKKIAVECIAALYRAKLLIQVEYLPQG